MIHNYPKDSDGTTGFPLNSQEGMAMKGTQAPQRKLAVKWASQTEMSHV